MELYKTESALSVCVYICACTCVCGSGAMSVEVERDCSVLCAVGENMNGARGILGAFMCVCWCACVC